MVVRWLQTFLKGHGAVTPSTDAVPTAGKAKASSLVDMVHEAVKGDAALLRNLLTAGMPKARRARRREKIKGKVSKSIDPLFTDANLIEEITESLASAAEMDPYYQKLFTSDETK